MEYLISQVVELTGVAPRTIRNYIALKLVPPPHGVGPGAWYDDRHVAQIITVKRLTAQGNTFEAIKQHVAGWTLAKFRRFVKDSEPEPEAAPQPASEVAAKPGDGDGDGDEMEGEPVSRRALPPRRDSAIERADDRPDGAALPDGVGGRVFRLLPHVVLWLGDDASPYEIEAAESIWARFAPRGETSRSSVPRP
jgi:DNA-binding transcriptional MerR regulator